MQERDRTSILHYDINIWPLLFNQVIAVGPGPLDEEGNRTPVSLTTGSTVLYAKYAGSEFKSADGSEYIALRASDVIAVLSS